MQCDVRYMHQDDVLPMWLKVRKHLHRGDFSFDSEDSLVFLELKALTWRFCASGQSFVFRDGKSDPTKAVVMIEYYPPNGGRVRFDSHVHFGPVKPRCGYDKEGKWSNAVSYDYETSCPQLVREYGEAAVKYGHQGKNRLNYFENLDESAGRTSVSHAEKKPWWKVW